MSTHQCLSLITVVILLFASSAGPALASIPSTAGPVSAEASLPGTLRGIPGATDDWWAAVQKDIRQGEYPTASDSLGSSPAWTAEGDQINARFGSAAGTAGDVNGDGFGDVIIGAPYYTNGQTYEGRAYVYLGGPGGLASAPAWTAESNQDDAYFGTAVGTAGDVNGDGYSDVIVGAYYYTNSQEHEGGAFVWLGSAAGLGDNGTPANADWIAYSSEAWANLGEAVGTAGDVNGDGYSDVIVGAWLYGEAGQGAAFAWYGSVDGVNHDVNGTPANAAWAAVGDIDYAYLGSSVGTAGDVNGDGFSDIIVGAEHYTNGQTGEGRVFVYHGSSSGLAPTAAWSAESNQDGASFGNSVSTVGDVNGDGYSDVIVGAYIYDNASTYSGRAFVWYGSVNGVNNDVDGTPANAAWTAVGDQESGCLGVSAGTAGDTNGDGYSDVVVSAPYYDNGQTDEGRVWVYQGSASGLSTTPDWTAEGNQADAWFGFSVATAGDVNGDGYSDVIIGAQTYDDPDPNEGAVFVYHGGARGLADSAGWNAESNQAAARLGYSVATAGDVNGDGYSDVVVGAYLYDNGQTNEGRAYAYYGSANGLSTTPNWTAEGDQDGAGFGYSVAAAGDVNGDGHGDVIVGAPYYTNGQLGEGRVFLYYGSSGGLTPAAAWTAESNQDQASFGKSVSTAGDVNGDGYSDIVIGALYFTNGQANEGRAFVYLGGASGLAPAAAWTAESNQSTAYFGTSVATAGDANGDGYSDVVVGAPSYDNGQTNEGRTYLYYGSASGLASSASWTAESDQTDAWFGTAVGTAGDVNGDGFGDVIIGAPSYTNGQMYEGRAYVYLGSAGGLASAPAWTAESNQGDADFGTAVGTAGDVNGDGYGDVIIGAPYYNSGQVDEGRAYVYLGGAGGLAPAAAWTAESNQAYSFFGTAVASAGDVNGDGYGDVVVGIPYYDNPDADEGQGYAYYGNGGAGAPSAPQQRRANGSAPIAPGGQSISPTQVRLAILGRSPFGRGDVKLQWEIKPEGNVFSGSGLAQSAAWQDSTTAGYAFNELVGGLTFEARYHWRVRLLYHPGTTPFQAHGRWLYGSTFLTALSGDQAIAGTGRTFLLGQSAYVTVSALGTLNNLSLRGYPNTAHPQENFHGGAAEMLDRYFTLTPNGGAGSYVLTLCLNYADSEMPSGHTENQLRLCRWTGTGWACPERGSGSSTSANLVCADTVTAFSDWTIGAVGPTALTLRAASIRPAASVLDVLGPVLVLGLALSLWGVRRRSGMTR